MLYKKNNDLIFIITGHNLIKTLINQCGFKQCYKIIFGSLFLSNIKNIDEFFPKKVKVKFFFDSIVKKIYEFDELEYICANCYSVSLYCQLLAYLAGLETKLVYGYKKEDESLIGHAWLIITENDHEYTINPGNIILNDYHIIESLSPKEIIRRDMKDELLGSHQLT